MAAFAKALENGSECSNAPYITSQNDWAPVHSEVLPKKRALRRSKKGATAGRAGGEGIGGFLEEQLSYGISHVLLRWPILFLVLIWIGLLAIFYAAIRGYVAGYEYLFTWRGKRRKLREELRKAESYEQWIQAARNLDDYLGFSEWKSKDPKYAYYDYKTVISLVRQLKNLNDKCEKHQSINQAPLPSIAAATTLTAKQSQAQQALHLVDRGQSNVERSSPRRPSSTHNRNRSSLRSNLCQIADGGMQSSPTISSSLSQTSSSPSPPTSPLISPLSTSPSLVSQLSLSPSLPSPSPTELHDVEELCTILQGCVKYNFAGTQGRNLYSQCYYGTKDVVEEYNRELVRALGIVADSPLLPRQNKRILFKLFSKNFGKSALCLSGGGCFAYRHFGVVKALLKAGLLPNIISGTSGGGLVAALVCTRTNAELEKLLVPELADKITACWEKFPAWVARWYRTGARFDAVDWAERSCWFTMGSMTFLEAFQRTGKILNISTVPADPHSPAILCNYITSPNAVIWSALLASSAVPGILNPVVLMMKTNKHGDDNRSEIVPYSFGNKWKDGSLRTDIPIHSLNTYFNVNFSIVSQVNPHITLFFYAPRGTVGRPVSRRKGTGWRGGFVGSALETILKLEIHKWLKLLKNLKIVPRLMDQDWSNIWLQQFAGTVTVWPKIRLVDFWHILDDPTREKLAELILSGERSTYPRLLFIRHFVNIERAIERGRRKSSSRLQPQQRQQQHQHQHNQQQQQPLSLRSALLQHDPHYLDEYYHSTSGTDQPDLHVDIDSSDSDSN